MYESEIRKALQGTILKNMSQEDLIETTSNLMSELYLVLGFKLPDSNTFSTIILHMINTLQTCYQYLTIEEVKLCFEMGARGDLGQFVGLNVYTLSTWLNLYRNSDIRQKVKSRIQEEKAEAEKIVRNREAAKHFNFEDYVQQCYEAYLEYGTERLIIAPFTFDRLRKMNMIFVSDEKLRAMIGKYVERKKKREKNQTRGETFKMNKFDLRNWLCSSEMQAKEELVIDYFSQLKSIGMEQVPFEKKELTQ